MFRFSRKSRKIIPAWTRIVIKGYAHGGPEAEEGCSVSLVSASGPQPNGARGTGRCATRSATRAANLIVPGNAANPIGDAVRQLYGREPSNFFFLEIGYTFTDLEYCMRHRRTTGTEAGEHLSPTVHADLFSHTDQLLAPVTR